MLLLLALLLTASTTTPPPDPISPAPNTAAQLAHDSAPGGAASGATARVGLADRYRPDRAAQALAPAATRPRLALRHANDGHLAPLAPAEIGRTSAVRTVMLQPDSARASRDHRLRGAPPDSIVTGRLLGVTGTLVGINAALYIYQRHAWWAAEHRGRFHFHDDGGYSEHLDKVGHFHATFLQSQIIARSLRWSGLSHESAALWGALAAYTLQLNVEINDGFNELWGFDPYDLLANTLGAGFFYARERVPALQPFVLKFTYWPSEHLTAEQEGAFEDRPPSPIDDYLGHTYWVSMRVHDVLPEAAQPYWPRWLAVAAGVSGDQLYTPEAQRSYYLALDLDMERIIPTETWLGRTVVEILSFLKVPAPAVRLTPRPTFYLVYYGQN